MATLTPIPQMHMVWGDPEVLSCYSSSCHSSCTERSGAAQPTRAQAPAAKMRSLPKGLQQYLNQQVVKAEASSASCSSASATSSLNADDVPRPLRAAGPAAQAPSAASSSHAPVAAEAAEAEVEANSDGAGSGDEPESACSPGGMASKGSALHEQGKCKPCLYMNSKLGCMNGAECDFCHLPHQKRRRPRPCKSTRMKCKELANILDAVCPAPEQVLQATEELGAQSQYMRTVLLGRQKAALQAASKRGRGAEGCPAQPIVPEAGATGAGSTATGTLLAPPPQVSVVSDGMKKLVLSM